MSRTFYHSQVKLSSSTVDPEFLNQVLTAFQTVVKQIGKPVTHQDIYFILQKTAKITSTPLNCSVGQVKLACDQLVSEDKISYADELYSAK